MTRLNINGRDRSCVVNSRTTVLWTMCDTPGTSGTEFGCGAALCGACTVHVDDQATHSCVTPISAVEGRPNTAVEAVTDG